jgi:hypothetical protein
MVLTFVFGIVPATLLVVWAVVMGAAGVAALFLIGHADSALMGLLLIAASVCGVYGYVALFFAAGDEITPKIARWLSAGVVANVVGLGLLAERLRWFTVTDWILFVAPLAVGCAHLIRYGARAVRRRASP